MLAARSRAWRAAGAAAQRAQPAQQAEVCWESERCKRLGLPLAAKEKVETSIGGSSSSSTAPVRTIVDEEVA